MTPGAFGVAFALNMVRAMGADFTPVLTIVVIGTIASSLFAALLRSQRATREADGRAGTGDCCRCLGPCARRNGEPCRRPEQRWRSASRCSARGSPAMLLRRFHLPRLTGYLLFGVLVGPVPRQRDHGVDGRAAPGGHRHRDDADRAHRGPDAERRAARRGDCSRNRADDRRHAGVVDRRLAVRWLDRVAVAAGRARRDGVARLVMVVLLVDHGRQLLADDDGGRDAETGARGRLSELVLAIVVLADLVLLVLFSFSMQMARVVFGADAGGVSLLVRFAWEIGGAVAFGVLVGALFALYLRYVGREVTLVLLARVRAAESGRHARSNSSRCWPPWPPGSSSRTWRSRRATRCRAAVQRGAPPVLVVFFVAVGASLRLDALAGDRAASRSALAVVRTALDSDRDCGVGLSVSRDSTERVGEVRVDGPDLAGGHHARLSRRSSRPSSRAGAHELQTLLVALIAIHELVGPMLFRQAACARAGELDARAPRPLVVVSNREPYLHVRREDGSVAWTSRDRRRRRGARRADARTRRRVDRARRGLRRPAWSSTRGQGAGSARDIRRTRCAGCGSRSRRSPRTTAASRTKGCGRSATWSTCGRSSAARTGRRTRTSTRASPRRSTRSSDPPTRRSSSRTITWPSSRRRCARGGRHARTALFWHIPVAVSRSAAHLSVAPRAPRGLLANDLLAFQLERDRRNFLLAAEEELDAEVELEASRVLGRRPRDARSSRCRSASTTIASRRSARTDALAAEQQRLRRAARIFARRHHRPRRRSARLHQGHSRAARRARRAADAAAGAARPADVRADRRAVALGPRTATPRSKPRSAKRIADAQRAPRGRRAARRSSPTTTTPLGDRSLVALYRLAHFCIVSSLHDGMNLVAKEFVAARDDEDGVLVLSALAGAAQELQDALIINPYDVDGFADALVARDRHAARGAARAHARDAARRRRTQRLRLGVRHPGRAREPLDATAALCGPGLGGHRNLACRPSWPTNSAQCLAAFAMRTCCSPSTTTERSCRSRRLRPKRGCAPRHAIC